MRISTQFLCCLAGCVWVPDADMPDDFGDDSGTDTQVPDTDTDTDVDSDSDSDVDTDTDADTDSDVDTVCPQVLRTDPRDEDLVEQPTFNKLHVYFTEAHEDPDSVIVQLLENRQPVVGGTLTPNTYNSVFTYHLPISLRTGTMYQTKVTWPCEGQHEQEHISTWHTVCPQPVTWNPADGQAVDADTFTVATITFDHPVPSPASTSGTISDVGGYHTSATDRTVTVTPNNLPVPGQDYETSVHWSCWFDEQQEQRQDAVEWHTNP